MEFGALAVSVLSLAISVAVAFRQLRLARHTNAVPVLVDLFREHRSTHLATARAYVYNEVEQLDLTHGLDSIPIKHREAVRDLLWFYDNLGVLVLHRIVDIRPVSGYLGGAAQLVWSRLEPMIQSERGKRDRTLPDAGRWQEYFERLVEIIEFSPPERARESTRPYVLRYRRKRAIADAIEVGLG